MQTSQKMSIFEEGRKIAAVQKQLFVEKTKLTVNQTRLNA
jgi:hypothetical protein